VLINWHINKRTG